MLTTTFQKRKIIGDHLYDGAKVHPVPDNDTRLAAFVSDAPNVERFAKAPKVIRDAVDEELNSQVLQILAQIDDEYFAAFSKDLVADIINRVNHRLTEQKLKSTMAVAVFGAGLCTVGIIGDSFVGFYDRSAHSLRIKSPFGGLVLNQGAADYTDISFNYTNSMLTHLERATPDLSGISITYDSRGVPKFLGSETSPAISWYFNPQYVETLTVTPREMVILSSDGLKEQLHGNYAKLLTILDEAVNDKPALDKDMFERLLLPGDSEVLDDISVVAVSGHSAPVLAGIKRKVDEHNKSFINVTENVIPDHDKRLTALDNLLPDNLSETLNTLSSGVEQLSNHGDTLKMRIESLEEVKEPQPLLLQSLEAVQGQIGKLEQEIAELRESSLGAPKLSPSPGEKLDRQSPKPITNDPIAVKPEFPGSDSADSQKALMQRIMESEMFVEFGRTMKMQWYVLLTMAFTVVSLTATIVILLYLFFAWMR